jgi:GAF domain-containing protein
MAMTRDVVQDFSNYPDIVQNTSEQANLLTDIIAKLRSCDRESQILSTTVNQVRQAVQCDRAVIYSLLAADRGKIVAESVAPDYPKTLDTTIVDPCFEARYIDKYQMGRVRAVSNIYQAGMTPCYIENLEKIGVKANLVVPILSAPDQLYGLLVLHQCSAPRAWQSNEIDLAIQIATQVGYAMVHLARSIECENLRLELQQVNEWRDLLPQINQKLYASRNRLEVLQIAVSETQRLLKCDRVVVYSLQANAMGKIAVEVTQPALSPILGRVIVDPCFDYHYSEQYQNGRVRAIDNIHTAGMSSCYVETLNKIGVKSNLVAPILLDNGVLLGLLVAHHCFEYRHWQVAEIERVRQIAMQTGLALTSARMREKRAIMQVTTKTMTEAKGNIRSALQANAASRISAEELSSIMGEMRSLTRLLEQETLESTQKTTLEAQRLLHIIAKRLQGNVDRWQTTQQQMAPSQQQVAELLENTLQAIEKCPL